MSSPTERSPVRSSSSWIARETSSRGASSSTKRSPRASCSVAPSPRIASVMRKPSRPRTPITAVGWNCSSSRSASAAPAACASSMPTPCEPGGLVVRDHSAAAPPVAITTARASDHDAAVADEARGSGLRASTAPARERPRARDHAASSAASAESWRRRGGPSRCRRRVPRAVRSGRPPGRARAGRSGRRRSARRAPAGRGRGRAPRARGSRAAERRTRPRPARSVSARWSSKLSSAASAAARPPWAQ